MVRKLTARLGLVGLTAALLLAAGLACRSEPAEAPTPTARAATATPSGGPASTPTAAPQPVASPTSAPTAPPQARPQGTLRVARGEVGFPALIPSQSGLIPSDVQIWAGVFETGAYRSPDGVVVPRLAESWQISPDGTTYTFKLRRGVPFHGNWGEMTSADWEWTAPISGTPPIPTGPTSTRPWR